MSTTYFSSNSIRGDLQPATGELRIAGGADDRMDGWTDAAYYTGCSCVGAILYSRRRWGM